MIDTQEWDGSKMITIKADFRKYPRIEDSIRDHSAYLLGAKNGSKLRYDGLLKCKNYKEAITLIKNGGYATDPNYISKICTIIQRFNLDRYDAEIAPADKKVEEEAPARYDVQCGVFMRKSNARALANDLTKAGFRADVRTAGEMKYIVSSNRAKDGKPFKKKQYADRHVAKLHKASFAAIVKEI
jgi:hypothetical protein